MSAPLPVELSLGFPCPACGDALVIGHTAPTRCGGCGGLVGSPRLFVDEDRRLRPLRRAFSHTPLHACCRCRGGLQKVLVGDVAGSYCGGCDLVVVARGASARVLGKDATRVQVESSERPAWLRRHRGSVLVVVVAAAIWAAVPLLQRVLFS